MFGEDRIKMGVRKQCEGVEWIELSRDSVLWWSFVYTVMNLLVR
jgi:hypothetical protein